MGAFLVVWDKNICHIFCFFENYISDCLIVRLNQKGEIKDDDEFFLQLGITT